MISRSFLASVALVLGVALVLFVASPTIVRAQSKTDDAGSKSAPASKLEQARAISTASGRPILAVAGLES